MLCQSSLWHPLAFSIVLLRQQPVAKQCTWHSLAYGTATRIRPASIKSLHAVTTCPLNSCKKAAQHCPGSTARAGLSAAERRTRACVSWPAHSTHRLQATPASRCMCFKQDPSVMHGWLATSHTIHMWPAKQRLTARCMAHIQAAANASSHVMDQPDWSHSPVTSSSCCQAC